MQRDFLFNILLLVLINVLIKPFFIFGIDLNVQNQAAPGAYGLYFALLNWTFLFQILNDFGLQNFNSRLVSQHPQLVGKYLPKLLTIKLLFSLAYSILAMATAWLVARYDAYALGLLAILVLNQVLSQFIIFLRTNISGLGHYRLDSFLSSLDKLLMLFFCGGTLLLHKKASGTFPIEWFAWAQTLALLCTVLIIWKILLGKIATAPTLSFSGISKHFRSPLLRVLVRQSLPFALVILLMSAYTRLDGILLERLLPDGAAHADIYAGAYRLLDASNMFGYLFATLLMPMFARLLGKKENIRPLTALSFKLIWAGCITLASAIFFFRQEMVTLMFPGKTQLDYRADVLGILIWVFVPVCTTYIFSTLLTADRRLRQMNRFFVAGLALDLILNLILVPKYQAVGSAWATLLTQTFVAVSMVVLSVRSYHFRSSIRGLVQVTGFVVLVICSDYAIYTLWQNNWIWRLGGALAAGGIWALLIGLIDIKNLKRATLAG